MFQKVKGTLSRVSVGATALALSVPVYAQTAPSLSDLTDAIDFSDVLAGIIAVGAALAAVYVLWRGARIILSAIKS